MKCRARALAAPTVLIGLCLAGCRGGGDKLSGKLQPDAAPQQGDTRADAADGADAGWSSANTDDRGSQDGDAKSPVDNTGPDATDAPLVSNPDGGCPALADCPNADPDHCVAFCDVTSPASCRIAARDDDHDGHGVTLCAAAPGDDCDDSMPSVFAGAPELCDGLDNDCDALVDSFDGLPLGGKVVLFVKSGYSGSVGLASTSTGYSLEFLQQLSYGGQGTSWVGLIDREVANAAVLQSSGLFVVHPAVAVDGNLAAFARMASGGSATEWRVDIDNAVAVGSPMPHGTDGMIPGISICRSATENGFAFAWTEGDVSTPAQPPKLQITTHDRSGALAGQSSLTLPGQFSTPRRPGISAGPSGYGLVWVDAAGAPGQTGRFLTLRLSLLTDDDLAELVPSVTLDSWYQPDAEVSATEKSEDIRPQIVGSPDGYTVGWFDENAHLQVQRFTSSGSVRCGPVRIDGATGWGFSNSLVAHPSGALAAVTEADAQARLVWIDDRCVVAEAGRLNSAGSRVSLGQPVTGMNARLGQPAITFDAYGIAATWIEEDVPVDGGTLSDPLPYRVMLRTMSHRMCD